MYYSLQGPGAALGLHMDERHEATKGHRGWETTDRRSVSWLLYLSGDGWGQPAGAGAGGHLRAYCRRCAAHVSCGAHEGNLQVGWLDGGGEAAAGGWSKTWPISPSQDDWLASKAPTPTSSS